MYYWTWRSLFSTVVNDMIFNKCRLEINDDHEDKADKECSIKKTTYMSLNKLSI